MMELIQKPSVIELVLAVIALIGTFIANQIKNRYLKDKEEGEWERVLYQAAEAGVQETYDSYVRQIKKASEDGTLTDEERQTALNKAIETAYSHARDRGYDLAKRYGPELLKSAIENVITGKKKEANQAKRSDG